MYFTVFGLDTVSASELWSYPPGYETTVNFNASFSPETSKFLEINDPEEGPAVFIPKYNNIPVRRRYMDDVTKAIISLKNLNVKPPDGEFFFSQTHISMFVNLILLFILHKLSLNHTNPVNLWLLTFSLCN